jgi:hypothetical protein
LRVRPHLVTLQGAAREALYEPGSIRESLRGQLQLLGATWVKQEDAEVDLDLLVWCPDVESRDLWLDPGDGFEADLVGRFEPGAWTQVEDLGEKLGVSGAPLVVADLRFANGGDMHLVEVLAQLQEDCPGLDLRGYSSWNTASNSLGSALALGVVALEAPEVGRMLFARRLLEDVLYQALVRGELRKEHSEVDAWGLPETLLSVLEREAQARMESALLGSPLTTWIPSWPLGLRVTLPWRRFFEIGWKVVPG